MAPTESTRGRIVLVVGHVAGMVDLVALPVWVGTLMQVYRLDAQKAGALVTMFLLGVVVASLVFAPRFERLRARRWMPAGYTVAALAFAAVPEVEHYAATALLHALGGLAVGCSLSFVHGTIGRSANPHRLWATAGLALGGFAIVFLGGMPIVVQRFGGPGLFYGLAAVMAIAAGVSTIDQPLAQPGSAAAAALGAQRAAMPVALRWAIAGVVCLTVTQSMMFSFVERIGTERGFGLEHVVGVLIAIGFVNLLPAALAGLLQFRLAAHKVAMAGPVVQGLLALVIAQSAIFAPYAVATTLLPFVTIFTHTFVFGAMARLDPSGRAVALTPAMLMTGSAVGPLLGGTLVVGLGYGSLGFAGLAIAALGLVAFSRLRPPPTVPAPAAPAALR